MSHATRPLPNAGKRKALTKNGAPSASTKRQASATAPDICVATPVQIETRYTALTQHLRDGVVVYRAVDGGDDFIIVEFNPAAEAIEKYPKEDVLGRRVTEMFPGVAQFGLLTVLQRVWRTGRTEHFPLRRYQDNRISGWRDNLVYRVPDGDVVALYRDETDRKQFEETIKRSNQTLRAAQEMARLGYWQYDTATRQIEWSNQMFALLALDPAQGVPSPKDQNNMVHPEDRRIVSNAIRHSLESGESREIVFRMILKDQSTHWFTAQYHPQINEDGDITGLSGIMLDITEIKEAEVTKTTLEIQLRRAQKMEAIHTITGGIAHDFNNILGIILGNAELAKDGVTATSEEGRNLAEIVQATLRAKEIIRQLMSFSRNEPSQLTTVDLAALVKESMGLIRAVVPSNIAIRQGNSPDRKAIRADAGQIHQVLLNLCTNAMHAMEPDGGLLDVTVTEVRIDDTPPQRPRGVPPGDYICLGIRDTGHGIDPQCMERIFDPYFTTKEVGKGSGLGLAVVHGIVQRHGAAITVESQKGRGSHFTVYFPRTGYQPVPEEPDDGQTTATGTGSILFVDDEPSLVKTGKALLQRMGYRVATAKDGNEALGVIRRSPRALDLVISDMTMPGLGGERLAEKIRVIRPDLPILLCTGYSDRLDPTKAGAMGVYYAEKPLDRNKLGRMVREILDARAKNGPDGASSK